LLVAANVVPSSPILVTLTMEAIRFSETSVLTRATQRNIEDDGSLQISCCFQVITNTVVCYTETSVFITPGCQRDVSQVGERTLYDN
jgi:hypothetical protein